MAGRWLVGGSDIRAIRRGAPGRWSRDAALVSAVVLLVLALPPLLYALLVYWRFGYLKFSYYVPYEELFAAFRTGNPAEIFGAPLVSGNLTSGDLLANMFTLSAGQLLLSAALGVLMGLILVARRTLRAVCPTGRRGTATAAGTSLAATVGASGAGLLGCCGPGLSGGILALLGVSATTAHTIADVSPAAQSVAVALLAVSYVRLRRRARGGVV
jgi:hypothetical protein